MWMRFRATLRLINARDGIQFVPLPTHSRIAPDTVTLDVHRFEESIAGRLYQIEVKNVSTERWRAYIVRLPGVPTALMPFYGRTPVEAAEHLFEWLTRAHARAANPVGTV